MLGYPVTLIKRAHRGGKLAFSGTESGKLELVRDQGDLIVLKEHGHKYFGGQGQPFRYSPARFVVLSVQSGSLDEGRVDATIVSEFLCRPVPGAADPWKP